MKMLVTPRSISDAMQYCMKSYHHYYWSVAWAGWDGKQCEFKELHMLSINPRRFTKIVIGTHFYQTHPEFIRRFRGHDGIRFCLINDELFHPKVYFFENGERDWACIVGSANFTVSALTRNVEACLYFTSDDPVDGDVRRDILSMINNAWKKASPGNEIDIAKYTKLWSRSRKAVMGKSTPKKRKKEKINGIKIDHEGAIGGLLKADWKQYSMAVTSTERYKDNCGNAVLAALDELHVLWRKKEYALMNDEERKKLLGTSGNYAWLGDMKHARIFMRDRAKTANKVSAAMAKIPLNHNMDVTRKHYDAFLRQWQKIPHAAIGVATRLLAVRRPDVFCSVNRRCRDKLCGSLGIRSITLENYWNDCIEVLRQSAWWNSPKPVHVRQKQLWDVRMALIDFLVCDE